MDLIDSMLVVDPKDRLSIDQCLVHPWITQAAFRQETLAKPAPVLHRKPTMLGARQMAPLSTYSASLKGLQRPKPGYSPPDPTIMTSKTEGKVKISSVDLDCAKHLTASRKLIRAEALSSKTLRYTSRAGMGIRISMASLGLAIQR